ncbi:retention module-containing protein [Campylobacter concisus]|uniref:retention module-containing protein n=1 Tax=Campylobacter concisus TaxID=199 RepID=UPI0011E6A12F|nr:retention module-containing protein [Campylobacter concisus]
MSNEIAVVKSISGDGAKAINNLGEARELHESDIVYNGEKIVTESANSKVKIVAINGKEVTLIGKDSLNLDQETLGSESPDTKKMTSIDDLQKAILSGKDLNALEETAAGGSNGGNAGGDGVSLGEAKFSEGGHYSNINENFRNLNGSGRNFESPVGSVDGYADNISDTGFTQLISKPTLSIVAQQDMSEDGIYDVSTGYSRYLTFDFSLNKALNVLPTTLSLKFSGIDGKDYYKSMSQYSIDGGNNWISLGNNQIFLNDPNDIANLKVRYYIADDYGQTSGYQNEGEMIKDLGAGIAPGINNFGDYKRNLTLSVTSDNDEISTVNAIGAIIDNDNNILIDQDIDGVNLDTGSGDDTIKMTSKAVNSYIKESDYGDNKLILEGAGLDNTTIRAGRDDEVLIKDSELKNNSTISTGDGIDSVAIENSKLFNSTINVGDGSYGSLDNTEVINIKNSELADASIAASNTKFELNIDKTSVVKGIDIRSGKGDDLINIHTSILKSDTLYNTIVTGNGKDTINIDSGATIDEVMIETQLGDDTININDVTITGGSISTDGLESISPIDKDTFNINNSTLKNGVRLYGGLDTDTFNIENITVDQNGYGGDSFAIDGGRGNDIFNIRGTIDGKFNDVRVGYLSEVISGGDGDDTVNFESGSVVNYSKIYGEWSGYIGNDMFNIKSGATLNNSMICGMDGNDTFNIKSGSTLNNTQIYGDGYKDEWRGATGNDIVNVEKGAVLNNVSIDGGSGEDTLIVRENNIDFSKVKNFEKLSLGGDVQSDNSIVDSESANLRLSAADVKDILRDTGKIVLKIDGDSSDRLKLDGFDEHSAVSAGDYTKYASLDGTISIEIKDGVVSSF